MQLHGNAGSRPRQLVLAMTAGAALAMTLAACSGSGSTGTQVTATQSAKATAAARAATAPAQAAANSGLSGKWRGQYSGAFQGHFVLRWHQSGSRLNGTITLSAPARGSVPIHGTVQGSTIKFGTVGSEAITYSGSVSGSSMSGTWQIKGPGGAAGGGPWSASRS
ncbi:MAG TPA: hypothetical protein VG123_17000 [Streptosporangiaceae bacterium]|jgi:hypothetical protein|nr:hypothetical protein [Streptosporangiaceae bacterium]